MSHAAQRTFTAGILFFLTVFSLFAQYGAGTILGTVTDSTGAIVPGVTITLKNQETGETRVFSSDSAGNFRFSAVPPGAYTVTAAAPSFKTAVTNNVQVA